MDPISFVRDCCDPGYPVGYQNIMIEDQAVADGWTFEQMQEAKKYALDRYMQNDRFAFPKTVRYV